MTISVTNYGTLTSTASEQTLGASRTDGKTYVMQIDLTNMTAGDIIEIRAKAKVLTGSTEATLYRAVYSNAQPYAVVQSPPIPAPYQVTFTLKRIAGTDRDYDYALMSL